MSVLLVVHLVEALHTSGVSPLAILTYPQFFNMVHLSTRWRLVENIWWVVADLLCGLGSLKIESLMPAYTQPLKVH